jgi:aspartate 1-decarboxylase
MLRRFLQAKIRDIVITGANTAYEGSITLDANYLEKAGILENEAVDVLNVSNGARFTTYAIPGKRGSGIVELNGPAARLGEPGDEVMVLAYAMLEPHEIKNHKPVMVYGPGNKPGIRRR